MRKFLVFAFASLFVSPLLAAQPSAVNGSCNVGGVRVSTSGLTSTTTVQQSYPSCTVTVYLTGTTDKATIYSDGNSTPLSNPFTARTNGSWLFYAATATGYDIVMTGGTAPNVFATPFTLTDIVPSGGGGGGGGGSPSAPINSIQVYGNSTTFLSSSDFTIDPNVNVLSASGLVSIKQAFEQTTLAQYDPMNTAYDGGLAAAYANTSGYTVQQVLQAAIDYGECQAQMGMGPAYYSVPVPANFANLQVNQVLLWSGVSFGGTPNAHSYMSHGGWATVAGVLPMITGHGPTDTLTCSNGTTYTPGAANVAFVHDLYIQGAGPVNSDNDIGIRVSGGQWIVSRISGFGNGFGGAGVYNAGFNGYMDHIGNDAQQIKGCMTYTGGVRPITDSQYGICGAIQDNGIDDFNESYYGTTGIQRGTALDPCGLFCAGIVLFGDNSYSHNMFAQVSTVGILLNGLGTKNSDWRIDSSNGPSLLMAYATYGGSPGNGSESGNIANVTIDSSCGSSSYTSAYNAGTPTGCAAIIDEGQGNNVTNVTFANSFIGSQDQCYVMDTSTGASFSPNQYSQIAYNPNPANTTANGLLYCAPYLNGVYNGWGNDHASARAVFPTSNGQTISGTSTINASGLTAISLQDATPITTILYGVPQQKLTIYGDVSGTSVVTPTVGNIQTCSGLSEHPGYGSPIELINVSGFTGPPSAAVGYGKWAEVCNTPQANYVHLNELGNGSPTNLSVVDFYGDAQTRQVPSFSISSATQLYGPTVGSGQYCYEQQNIYADGSQVVSSINCSTVDITSSGSSGEIFITTSPQAVAENLYIVSNTTGSSVMTGKVGAPAGGSNWPAGQLAGGGDGTTPPAANINTTGEYLAPFGVSLATTIAQPACSALFRDVIWTVQGDGSTTSDALQQCQLTSAGTYLWQSPGSGGGGTGTLTNFSSGSLSTIFTTAVTNPTTTPALAFTATPFAANAFLAGPTTGSSPAAPTARAIVPADIPTLNQNTTGTASNVTGIVAVANGGTGTATPSLVAGTNVTISGAFPNQTISATGGSGGTNYVTPSTAYQVAAYTTQATSGTYVAGAGITIDPTGVTLYSDVSYNFTGTVSSGSTAFTLVGTLPAGVVTGQAIYGPNIAPLTTIVVSGSTVTLSLPALATSTSTGIYYTPAINSGIESGITNQFMVDVEARYGWETNAGAKIIDCLNDNSLPHEDLEEDFNRAPSIICDARGIVLENEGVPSLGTAPIEVGVNGWSQIVLMPDYGNAIENTAATYLPTPTGFAPTGSTAAGTLPAGTYYLKEGYRTGDGVSAPTAEVTVTLASAGEIQLTIPACPRYTFSVDIGISTTSGGEQQVANYACAAGSEVISSLAAITYPGAAAMQTAATPLPGIIIHNNNHSSWYSYNGSQGGFKITPGNPSTVAMSNMIASGGSIGYNVIRGFFYNSNALPSIYNVMNDNASFAGSGRDHLFLAAASSGIAGHTESALYISGQYNDVTYYDLNAVCSVGATRCSDITIQATPMSFGDTESIHIVNFVSGLIAASGFNISPAVTITGKSSAGLAAGSAISSGIYNINFYGMSWEVGANSPVINATDVQGLMIDGGAVIGSGYGYATGGLTTYSTFLQMNSTGTTAAGAAQMSQVAVTTGTCIGGFYNLVVNNVTGVTQANNLTNNDCTGFYYGGGSIPHGNFATEIDGLPQRHDANSPIYELANFVASPLGATAITTYATFTGTLTAGSNVITGIATIPGSTAVGQYLSNNYASSLPLGAVISAIGSTTITFTPSSGALLNEASATFTPFSSTGNFASSGAFDVQVSTATNYFTSPKYSLTDWKWTAAPNCASTPNCGTTVKLTATSSTGTLDSGPQNISLLPINSGSLIETAALVDASASAQFKLPVVAGYVSLANGEQGYDSTGKNWHLWSNAVDSISAVFPASTSITNADCVQWSKVSGVITLADAGAACGTGGGGGVTFPTGVLYGNNSTSAPTVATSPQLVSALNNTPSSTLSSSLIPTLNQNTTGTAANVTGIVAIANGGTGTATPALVAGTNITITGTFPAQTINATGGISGLTTGYLPVAASSTTLTSSHINDGVTTASVLTATEQLNIITTAASQISLIPTSAAPSVVSGGTTIAAPATVTTAGTYVLPQAPGSGVVTAVNTSGVDQLSVTTVLPVSNGGTGTASPGLVAGTNVTITGTWPNQTINSSGGGGSYTALTQTGTTTEVLAAANSTSGDAVQFVLGSTSSASSNSTNLTIQSGYGNQSADLLDVNNAFGGAVFRVLPGGSQIQAAASTYVFGTLGYSTLATNTACAAIGTSASPSLVACSAAPAGAFSCATTANGATCSIADTAVTASSQIWVELVADEGSHLGVTCNTTPTSSPAIILASKTASTGFTINLPTFTTNPVCYDFQIIN